MINSYHVLARRPTDGALATFVIGDYWYFPVVNGPLEDGGATPSTIANALRKLGLRGLVRYLAFACEDGCRTSVDWTAVVDLDESVSRDCVTGVQWSDPRELVRRPSVLPYQRDVSCVRYLACANGTNVSVLVKEPWWERVHEWVAQNAHSYGYTVCGVGRVIKAGPRSAVVEFNTDDGTRLYWKASGVAGRSEARLASRLHGLSPVSFPRVLAVDEMRMWQLSEQSKGESVAHVGWTASRVHQVAAALIGIQDALMAGRAQLGKAGALSDPLEQRLQGLDVRLAGATRDLAQDQGDCVKKARATLQWLIERAMSDNAPPAWIHLDLHPANVFVGKDSVQFIDTQESWIGPRWLLLPVFASAVRRSRPADQLFADGTVDDDVTWTANSEPLRAYHDVLAECMWSACLFEHVDDAELFGEYGTLGASLKRRVMSSLVDSLCRLGGTHIQGT